MPIRRAYADCRDGQIHYRVTGRPGGEPVCLFHQTASSGVMFEQVMDRLGDQYRLYAFDTPGFGQSYQPASIPTVGYLSDRLMEAIASLDLGPFHACGHHTGGCVAVEMPVRWPQRVATLTIIGPVLVTPEEAAGYAKTFVRPFAIEPSGDFLRTAWDYLRMIGAGTGAALQTRELADHLVAHRTMPMAFTAVWRQDFGAFFRAIDCPLHLMCSRDDVLWPLMERARTVRPDAHVSIVEGGDFQPDNDPDGVADALRAFLRRHAGATRT